MHATGEVASHMAPFDLWLSKRSIQEISFGLSISIIINIIIIIIDAVGATHGSAGIRRGVQCSRHPIGEESGR